MQGTPTSVQVDHIQHGDGPRVDSRLPARQGSLDLHRLFRRSSGRLQCFPSICPVVLLRHHLGDVLICDWQKNAMMMAAAASHNTTPQYIAAANDMAPWLEAYKAGTYVYTTSAVPVSAPATASSKFQQLVQPGWVDCVVCSYTHTADCQRTPSDSSRSRAGCKLLDRLPYLPPKPTMLDSCRRGQWQQQRQQQAHNH